VLTLEVHVSTYISLAMEGGGGRTSSYAHLSYQSKVGQQKL